MTESIKENPQQVVRYLGRRFRPLVCAVFGATATGLAFVSLPSVAIAQSELSSEEVQLVLERNKELLDAVSALTKKLGISPGDNPWADYQQQIQSLQSELGDVRGRLGLAERRMAQHSSLVDNLRTQHAERVEQLQQQLIQTSNSLDTAERYQARAGELKSQLLQTITSKNAEQVAQQQRLAELQSNLEMTAVDAAAKQKLIDGLRAELGSANISVKSLTAQLADNSNAVTLQNVELATLQQSNAMMQQQLQSRAAVVKRQDEGISRLLENLNSARNTLAEQSNLIALQTAEINELKPSNIALQQQLLNRISVIKRQDAGINRLLGKLGSVRESLQANDAAAKQRESQLFAEISQLQQERTAGKAAQREMRMSNRRMQAAYRKSDEAAGLLDIEMRQLNGELAAEREQRAVLQGHLDDTRQIADAAKARNREFKQKIAELETSLTQAGDEATRLSMLLQQSIDENSNLNTRLASATDQDAALQEKLSQTEEQLLAAREQEKMLNGFLDETRLVADKAKTRNRELDEQVTQARAELAVLNSDKMKLTEMNADLSQRLAEYNSALAQRAQQIEELQSGVGALEKSVAALERTNADIDKQLAASSEKGDTLQQNLTDLSAKAGAPRKAALALRDRVGKKLKEQGVTNTVLGIRPDNAVTFKIPNELLFVSGSARLNSDGRTLLQQVGSALKEAGDSVMVRIEGHTDSVPVAERFRQIFPSNWYLSVARAANTVDFLHNQVEMDPERLSATGFGEFNPLASNETAEGRNRNRRVEIVLIPGADAGQAGS